MAASTSASRCFYSGGDLALQITAGAPTAVGLTEGGSVDCGCPARWAVRYVWQTGPTIDDGTDFIRGAFDAARGNERFRNH